MRIVDDEGRLFGRVNVVDAAVAVVVVLAVGGAGVVALDAVVGGGDPATRYATVDLGDQPAAVADRIEAGDASVDGESVTVTDVYVGPGEGDNVSVVVRARLDGTLAGGSDAAASGFKVGGDPVRRGDDIDLEAPAYDAGGTVLRLEESGESLGTGTLSVLVEANLPEATRAAVESGDTYRVDGRPVATVERTVFPPVGNESARTDLVGLELRTIEHSGSTYFGGTPVRTGRTVGFETSRYSFAGTVTRWGSASPPGERTTTAATVVLRGVAPNVADGIEAGMVERRGDAVTATVTDARTSPATVVLTSEGGDIYERDHPRKVDVTIDVDLRTRRTDSGLQFHARPLREGSNVTLDLGTTTASGTVTDLGEPRPDPSRSDGG